VIKKGDIVAGPYWGERVRVETVEDLGDFIRLVVSTLESGRFADTLIPKAELERIKVLEQPIDFSSPPEECFLAVEATRFRYASLFDPLLAMNVSKVDPLPFQIEAVYGYVLKQPRIRFLIADDPGAGKTIMAGLIIKELKLRRLANRILIVVPGHLKDQWRRELKEKFDETFMMLDRHTFNANYGENPWESRPQIITSIDFAKQSDILGSLSSVEWDLTIVDEAHKMAAYRYGNKTEMTQRYRLGKVLSKTSNHLLFLTATPHKGDPDNFRLFIDLLVPGFFASNQMVEESLQSKDNPLFIRRLKEDLTDFEGKPIFTRRFPKTFKFELSDAEKDLYNAVTRYVIDQYNKASENERSRNVAFALMVLQRRMASSTYALLKSLERRKQRLEDLLKGQLEERKIPIIPDFEDIEDMEESERWEKEKEWEGLSLARDPQELRAEIHTLEELIEKAKQVVRAEAEVKLTQLKSAIDEGFRRIKEMGGRRKILIFTEAKDTLEYLLNKAKMWGYKVNFIHGGMSMSDRIMAEKVFRDETEIMIATEAAGEGINLQFCHIMVNYDIPWNPNRLEQRMGRIHRYGQQKDVYIFNLVAKDTREGQVLAKILDKLDEIRQRLGSDKVFDIIGDVFEGKNLHQLIIDAVTNAKTLEEVLKELDIKVDEERLEKIRAQLGESLATRYIDHTRIKEMAEKAREHRLIPEYVEEFFKRVMAKTGGRIRQLKDGFVAIDSVPHEIRRIAESEHFKIRFGIAKRSYPKATFDKDKAFKNPDAEFISFGHPVLEAVIEWVTSTYGEEARKGTVLKDPSGSLDGLLWLYVGEVRDGTGEVAGRKLIAVYDDGNQFKELSPAILWDLAPAKGGREATPVEESRVKPFVIKTVDRYKAEIARERERQASIKEKYGLRSLEYFIREYDADLSELYERQARGERVDLAIRNKEERKRGYESAKRELEEEIRLERTLSMTMPSLLTVIRVVPEDGKMAEDKEIETVGMEIAMEYERQQGRDPEDVSAENLGFDIRSKGKDETRYIEVKARAGEGDVALTMNEWLKARRFKDDYYLYVVAQASTEPVLYVIRNPVENLAVRERIEVVRFIVPSDEWRSKGSKVSK